MTNTSKATNYVGPFITMVFLFFIVGFLTVVFQQFQEPLKAAFLTDAAAIKNTLAVLVTFTWFLAYPLSGGFGAKWVDKHGYKGTLIRALIIMIVGLGISALSAWMGANTSMTVSSYNLPIAFFVFLLGSFVVGSAATVLQVVINPYLTACEVKGTSSMQRMSIGGSSNSIGTTIAPLFVAGVIFGGANMADIQISSVFVPFLVLIGVIAIVALVVSRLTLPTIEGTTNEGNTEALTRSVWSFRHLKLGVIGIFCYVGIEVAIGANINAYANWLGGTFAERAATMASLYWGGLLVGRLISSTLSKISAQTQLTVATVVAIVLVTSSMITSNPWLLVGVGLMHSIMWGAIFSLAIAKLGKYTAKASGALMIGVFGGAALPLLQSICADALGGAWSWTWLIVIAGEAYLLFYALSGHKVKESAE